jgi:hypothetical protein
LHPVKHYCGNSRMQMTVINAHTIASNKNTYFLTFSLIKHMEYKKHFTRMFDVFSYTSTQKLLLLNERQVRNKNKLTLQNKTVINCSHTHTGSV